NLTQDHLDFHKTLEVYRDAKRALFEMVDPDGNAAINADDPSASVMAAASRAPVVTYGITSRADVRAEGLRLHLGGSEFTAVTPHGRLPVRLRLHGPVNIYTVREALPAVS